MDIWVIFEEHLGNLFGYVTWFGMQVRASRTFGAHLVRSWTHEDLYSATVVVIALTLLSEEDPRTPRKRGQDLEQCLSHLNGFLDNTLLRTEDGLIVRLPSNIRAHANTNAVQGFAEVLALKKS